MSSWQINITTFLTFVTFRMLLAFSFPDGISILLILSDSSNNNAMPSASLFLVAFTI